MSSALRAAASGSRVRSFAGQTARLERAAGLLLLALTLGCRPGACGRALPAETGEGPPAPAGPVQIHVDHARRAQTIDGFGTTNHAAASRGSWYADLFYDDLQASILRLDLTPKFRAPYSDHTYNSPWFHGSPALPGPEGNNVRTYRDASDYTRPWNGRRAQIAVLGPDIEKNIEILDFDDRDLMQHGALAQRGLREKERLGDFKLIGSLWSPAPWLKRTSGTLEKHSSGVLPKGGTPFPFVWGGNFAGGVLDTSGTPLAIFDDSALGGTGPTSALTQFARGLSAFLLGFQRKFGVPFHAISIQNELGFEVFYNSCAYLRAEDYVLAVKTARRELDRHPELRSVQIIGPEDLLGNDGYTLWQLGEGQRAVPKNLNFMAAIAQDQEAERALAWFAVHGYGLDGVRAAGDQRAWNLWANGWTKAPGKGLPAQVTGARGYGKKSWMTETSGEPARWAAQDDSELSDSALGIATKIHSALTAGEQSAWLYWLLANNEPTNSNSLTDERLGARSPKYVAVKHFFRFIRPGAQRLVLEVQGGAGEVLASAFLHESSRQLTMVLINTGRAPHATAFPGLAARADAPLESFTSTADAPFVPGPSLSAAPLSLELPALSVTTLLVPWSPSNPVR